MASNSPAVSRGRGGGVVRAEASTRATVGLHRANAQLQQELDKIDRQAFTAVSNIANHQQAMKMSWRRLEAQRNSPKSTRAKSESSAPDQQPRKGLLMSSNKTRLYVSATPQVYSGKSSEQQTLDSKDTESEGETSGRRSSGGAAAQDDSEIGGRVSRPSGQVTASSPYVSSPFMYRRGSGPESALSPLTSSSQPSLVATTNKDTLLKVSHMMGLDSQSQGPKSFRGFYTDRALARFGAVQMTDEDVSEGRGEGWEVGEEGEGEEEEEGKEPTLAQKLEKIRSCRYIRHYRPDGTAVDEPFELPH